MIRVKVVSFCWWIKRLVVALERNIERMDKLNAAIALLNNNLAAYIAQNAGAIPPAALDAPTNAILALANQVGALVTPAPQQ